MKVMQIYRSTGIEGKICMLTAPQQRVVEPVLLFSRYIDDKSIIEDKNKPFGTLVDIHCVASSRIRTLEANT